MLLNESLDHFHYWDIPNLKVLYFYSFFVVKLHRYLQSLNPLCIIWRRGSVYQFPKISFQSTCCNIGNIYLDARIKKRLGENKFAVKEASSALIKWPLKETIYRLKIISGSLVYSFLTDLTDTEYVLFVTYGGSLFMVLDESRRVGSDVSLARQSERGTDRIENASALDIYVRGFALSIRLLSGRRTMTTYHLVGTNTCLRGRRYRIYNIPRECMAAVA